MGYEESARKWADVYHIPLSYLIALIQQESDGDPWAVRYEPKWRWFLQVDYWARRVKVTSPTERICQTMSWGLCQIMGSVSRELGHQGDISMLLDPDINIQLCCKKLHLLYKKHGTWKKALASYNAGHPDSKAGQRYARAVLARAEMVNIA